MLINDSRSPELSLYYLGGIVLDLLKINNNSFDLDSLYVEVQKRVRTELPLSFFYCAIDWIYLIFPIELTSREIKLCI